MTAAAPPSSSPLRTVLSYAGSFGLAALLLWLALRGVDLGEIGTALRNADFGWLPALVGVLLASHAVRAWRWKLLLDGLPDTGGGRVTFGTSLGAVLVGYMVNYVAPRAGEVVRTGIVARRARLPVAAVLGTVVLDRLLDMAMLALALLTLPFALGARLAALQAMTRNPLAGREGLAVALAAAGVAALAALWALRHRLAASRPGQALRPLLVHFAGGVNTLRTAPRRGLLVGLTALMWGLYGLLGYLPFAMLGMTGTYGLTWVDGWAMMLIGALGMVVPTPGGVGAFHYLVIEALTRLYGVARADASAYAVLSHGMQLVLYAVTGVLALVGLAAPRAASAAAPTVRADD